MLCLLLLLCVTAPLPLSGADFQTFRSGKHPKAGGMNIEVTYPGNFIAKEGDGPDTVQMFATPVEPSTDFYVNLTLQINAMPDYDQDVRDLNENPDPFIAQYTENMNKELDIFHLFYVKRVFHRKQVGLQGALVFRHDFGNEKTNLMHEFMQILYKGRGVNLSCIAADRFNDPAKLVSLYPSVSGTYCEPFFKTMRLLN
jgi:hypothetical protein